VFGNGRETHIRELWVEWTVVELAHETLSDFWEVVSSTRKGILYQALHLDVPIVHTSLQYSLIPVMLWTRKGQRTPCRVDI
jgi:deoxyhypusine synthase